MGEGVRWTTLTSVTVNQNNFKTVRLGSGSRGSGTAIRSVPGGRSVPGKSAGSDRIEFHAKPTDTGNPDQLEPPRSDR